MATTDATRIARARARGWPPSQRVGAVQAGAGRGRRGHTKTKARWVACGRPIVRRRQGLYQSAGGSTGPDGGRRGVGVSVSEQTAIQVGVCPQEAPTGCPQEALWGSRVHLTQVEAADMPRPAGTA
jgi:hypothetical protein